MTKLVSFLGCVMFPTPRVLSAAGLVTLPHSMTSSLSHLVSITDEVTRRQRGQQSATPTLFHSFSVEKKNATNRQTSLERSARSAWGWADEKETRWWARHPKRKSRYH